MSTMEIQTKILVIPEVRWNDTVPIHKQNCCNHEEEKTFNNALIRTEILAVIGRCSVSRQIVGNIENFHAFWGVCEQANSVEAPE